MCIHTLEVNGSSSNKLFIKALIININKRYLFDKRHELSHNDIQTHGVKFIIRVKRVDKK